MIRQEICYPNLNVKIACSHGGVIPANVREIEALGGKTYCVAGNICDKASVNALIADMMAKTSRLRSLLDEVNPDCLIEVDGGIDTVTQAICKENGVEVMVTGSAYFKAPNRAEFVRTIRK